MARPPTYAPARASRARSVEVVRHLFCFSRLVSERARRGRERRPILRGSILWGHGHARYRTPALFSHSLDFDYDLHGGWMRGQVVLGALFTRTSRLLGYPGLDGSKCSLSTSATVAIDHVTKQMTLPHCGLVLAKGAIRLSRGMSWSAGM